jgi:hypothetical protein
MGKHAMNSWKHGQFYGVLICFYRKILGKHHIMDSILNGVQWENKNRETIIGRTLLCLYGRSWNTDGFTNKNGDLQR